MEGRREIDGDDRIPLLDREFLDRRHKLDTRIVDENIHRSIGLLAERDHFGNFGRLGHVRWRMDRLDLEIALDRRAFLLDVSRRAHAVDDDIGASACESARISEADAAGRTGDDGGLACEISHYLLLLDVKCCGRSL
jgi:hypothetical protein